MEMSENSSEYGKRPKLDGDKTEIFRVYYDKNHTSFPEMIVIEGIALMVAGRNRWKIFKAFPSESIDTFLVCKN